MSVLLLRLEGPMQSWGTQSRFRFRDTGLEPSKSGVVGLLCAALGRPRTDAVDDLAALVMGVRCDREGSLQADFHTAGAGYERAGHGIVSRRYFLADASFLVALEGEQVFLERLDAALARPVWQMYLGRKSFVPSAPIRAVTEQAGAPVVQDGPLREALATWPLARTDEPGPVRLVLEGRSGATVESRNDVPISFADRTFAERTVSTDWIEVPT